MSGSRLLAIDTATSTAVVAVGDVDGTVRVEARWRAGFRHGEELLERVRSTLDESGTALHELVAVVVGTGPGAFTGLRVGLATAKGLAHGLAIPIVGVSTASALLASAVERGARPPLALLLPAGPADRVLVVGGAAPALLPAGMEPSLAARATVVAVDLEGRADEDALARGRDALAGLGPALLRLGADRLSAGATDDLARLVPEYVTLPRGVREQSGEVSWSRGRP
jgi:tRNA threonylcarbamoyladenosine biosynthesis protein TsaB